jgi:uncharacterized integral membrane protein (TIGR00698 family)
MTRSGATPVGRLRDLTVLAGLTAAAFGLARMPVGSSLGPLVVALLLGVALAATGWARRQRLGERSGIRFVARDLLRLGIVLLGARLDVRVLAEIGPWALAGSVVGVAVAFAAVEATGRALRLPVELRRAVAIGTAICGASAIAAALPLLRARAEHASLAIATISLVGTIGVLGFAGWNALTDVSPGPAALLAGATLQEVGHVVAAGDALSEDAAETALLVKLSRVVLLAPTLLVLGWVSRRARAGEGGPRPALVPGFVGGFLATSALVSLGVIPPSWAAILAEGGVIATAAAMAAIGLGVDLRVLRARGRAAVALGTLGFVALLATMAAYYLIVPA